MELLFFEPLYADFLRPCHPYRDAPGAHEGGSPPASRPHPSLAPGTSSAPSQPAPDYRLVPLQPELGVECHVTCVTDTTQTTQDLRKLSTFVNDLCSVGITMSMKMESKGSSHIRLRETDRHFPFWKLGPRQGHFVSMNSES